MIAHIFSFGFIFLRKCWHAWSQKWYYHKNETWPIMAHHFCWSNIYSSFQNSWYNLWLIQPHYIPYTEWARPNTWFNPTLCSNFRAYYISIDHISNPPKCCMVERSRAQILICFLPTMHQICIPCPSHHASFWRLAICDHPPRNWCKVAPGSFSVYVISRKYMS